MENMNIVFICSDQHSNKCLGYAGHPLVKTPNLDRIARQGIVFDNCYCGSPLCVPSRSGLMTGLYPSDCDSFCNSTVWKGRHPTWGEHLKKAGYRCLATGKMDLSRERPVGFEEINTTHEHWENPDITNLFRRATTYRIDSRGGVNGAPREYRHPEDHQCAQVALDFISRQTAAPQQPWAIFVGFLEPHPSFVALKEYYDLYPPDKVGLPHVPENFLEEMHFVYQEIRNANLLTKALPEQNIRRARSGYYGMITELDEYVGQIWDALQKDARIENTVFIYTSDHGEALGEHDLWFKGNLYEGTVSVPLVIAGAGLPQGLRIKDPVAHVDVVATLFDVTGAERPPALRGVSLLPLIRGGKAAHPGYVYSENHQGNTGSYMIRKGDWKYVHFTWYPDLLFNLADDPGEMRNLIDNPEVASIKEELKAMLYTLGDPEDKTIHALKTQQSMLETMTRRMSEDQLFETFRSRMGDGQAKALASRLKGR